jgi:flagellar hook-basal body complex protein FliE
MVNSILPISLDGDSNTFDQMSIAAVPGGLPAAPVGGTAELGNNPFESILSKAVESLNGVSRSEFHANDLIDRYLQGKADLQEVMVATSKMNIMIQLAVTTVSSAVTSFQQLTQMQI